MGPYEEEGSRVASGQRQTTHIDSDLTEALVGRFLCTRIIVRTSSQVITIYFNREKFGL